MSSRNKLLAGSPHAVIEALRSLGANLRTARLRRNLSLEEVGDRIGVSRRVVADAERGKPSTAAAVYVALLWAFGLESHLVDVAGPERDDEGLALARGRERLRARQPRTLDNDF